MKRAIKWASLLVAIIVLVVAFVAGFRIWSTIELDGYDKMAKSGMDSAAVQKLHFLARVNVRDAQVILAQIYACGGYGVKANDSISIYWKRRSLWFSTGSKDKLSQYESQVADYLLNPGDGIVPDTVRARRWLNYAKDNGYKSASEKLDALMERKVSP
jgi:TPR repeat protein